MFVRMGVIVVVGITMFINSSDADLLIAQEKMDIKSEPDPVNNHPLYRIRSLASNLSRITQDFEKKIHDRPHLEKLLEANATAQSSIRDIPVEKVLQLTEPFKPAQKQYGLEIDPHLQRLHEELVRLINTLSNDPDRLFLLRDYALTFQAVDKKIRGLKSEYEKSHPGKFSSDEIRSQDFHPL